MGLCLLAFIVGATKQFDLTLIARVPASEIIAFGSLPFLLSTVSLSRFSQRLGPIIGILLLWALGIFISDICNEFIMLRFIRAFMKPAFTGLWLLFFVALLAKDYRTLIFYSLGNVAAKMQNYLMPRSFTEGSMSNSEYEAIAFGLAPVVAAIGGTCALWFYRKNPLYSVACIFGAGVSLVILGAPRSSAAVYLLSGVILFYMWWNKRSSGRVTQLTFGRMFKLCFLGALLTLAIYYAYIYAAGNHWLGEYQYSKFVMQKKTIFGTNPIGLILAGRPQVFAAILGVIDKPILGHGSWTGWLMADYFFEAVSLVGTDAGLIHRIGESGGGVAGHSVFFGGWLENGLLAAIALFTIAYRIFREFLKIVQFDSPLAPLFISGTTFFFWAFLFSPFGTGTRSSIGLLLAAYVVCFHDRPYSTNRLSSRR